MPKSFSLKHYWFILNENCTHIKWRSLEKFIWLTSSMDFLGNMPKEYINNNISNIYRVQKITNRENENFIDIFQRTTMNCRQKPYDSFIKQILIYLSPRWRLLQIIIGISEYNKKDNTLADPSSSNLIFFIFFIFPFFINFLQTSCIDVLNFFLAKFHDYLFTIYLHRHCMTSCKTEHWFS